MKKGTEKNTYYGLKNYEGLENRAPHPTKKSQEVPLPPGTKTELGNLT